MDEDALASDVNAGIMEDAVSRAALLTGPVMNPQEIELALYARQRGKQIEPTKELASYLHDETKGELSDIRERLSGLTPKQRDDLEDYCQSSVPDFLLDVKEHVPDDDESKVSRFGWLGQRARGKKKATQERASRHFMGGLAWPRG
ncbi:MAG TPA: hypothetical protein VFC50_03810 [Candidatus Dormibacteraeota bacterium]|nr:hypothetical protein [Candidatus Dormibacteraeota bacterium]